MSKDELLAIFLYILKYFCRWCKNRAKVQRSIGSLFSPTARKLDGHLESPGPTRQ
jgi:hypothetical protein